MNKKKLGTGLAALALVAFVGVGGSLAWFTDTENATNNFTLNHVDIELNEPSWTGDVEKAMPGVKYSKNPTVTLNKGSSIAWVRIKPINVVVTSADGKTELGNYSLATTDELTKFGITLNSGWSLEDDGYFYFSSTLSEEESTSALFDSVTLPGSWDNDFVGAKVTIDVQAEAIQYNEGETDVQAAFAKLGGAKVKPYSVTSNND